MMTKTFIDKVEGGDWQEAVTEWAKGEALKLVAELCLLDDMDLLNTAEISAAYAITLQAVVDEMVGGIHAGAI